MILVDRLLGRYNFAVWFIQIHSVCTLQEWHLLQTSIKEIFKFRVDLDWTVSGGIVYVLLGFVVYDWLHAVEFTNYGGPTEA